MTASLEVREAMLAALPNLRAFAVSLTHNLDAADDLVQDTILRAWANLDRFEVGTNLNAWLFTILRNGFYGQHRKKRREVEDPDGFFAGRLRTAPEQSTKCNGQAVRAALRRLPPKNREALLLIAAEGLSLDNT